MSTAKSVLQNEVVTFIQHKLPGFPDGEYELKVSQKVDDAKGDPISGDTLHNEYQFAVQGDRFSLSSPSTLIDSVFPPDNAAGEYSAVLPHAVFRKESFPWSRDVKNPIVSLAEEPEVDADVPTWLYVLLLDEDDPVTRRSPTAGTIGDLFPERLNEHSTLKDNYSYFYMAKSTTLEPGQTLGDPIEYIDLPLEFFWKIAPTLDDLKLAAHVREVNLLIKATEPGGVGPGVPTGTYSVVFGNRLPQTNKQTTAYLVSFEGLGPLLPTDEGMAPKGDFDGSRNLRLAVLTSWTFASMGQPATFIDQLLELNGRKDPKGPDAANTNLRLEYEGKNRLIGDATTMGYVPLNTTLRTGEKAVSWYRGPLTPYLPKVTIEPPLASADPANAFDPTTGIMDQSYGAAWTLGRLLALQDTGFSTALYEWKKGLTQQVVDGIEDEILRSTFEAVLSRGELPERLRNMERVTAAGSLRHKTLHALLREKVEL